MNVKALLVILLIPICGGCANFETLERSTRLPHHGLAIHLDAPQRLVFSDKDGNLCAEPSPDALQAYAASLGAGISAPSYGAASLAYALEASSASIGLRTQSITLMRDALYRICEASHNGSLVHGDVVQLLERSQDLTLGVLAIEQLTGAVVARQAILTSAANASAAANISNTQASLNNAMANEELKKAAVATAEADAKKLSDQVTQTGKDLQAQKDKKPDPAVVAKLTAELAAQKTQVEEDSKLVAQTDKDLQAERNKKPDPAVVGKLAGDLTTQKAQVEKDKKLLAQTDKDLQAEKKKPVPDPARVAKLTADLTTQKAQAEQDSKLVAQTDEDLQAEKNKKPDPAVVAKLTTELEARKTQAEQDSKLVAQIDKDLQAEKNKKPDPAVVTKLTDDLATQKIQLEKANTAVTDAKAAYTKAQEGTQAIQKNLGAAIASGNATANAVATGAGLFSSGSDRSNVDKDTVAQIAEATKYIVATVTNKGHLTDTCINLMTRYAVETEPARQAALKPIYLQCQSVVEAYLARYIQGGGGSVPAPAPLTAPPVPGAPPFQ